MFPLVSSIFGCLVQVSTNATPLSLDGGDLVICEGSGILRAVIGSGRGRTVVADDVCQDLFKVFPVATAGVAKLRAGGTSTDLPVAAPLTFQTLDHVEEYRLDTSHPA